MSTITISRRLAGLSLAALVLAACTPVAPPTDSEQPAAGETAAAPTSAAGADASPEAATEEGAADDQATSASGDQTTSAAGGAATEAAPSGATESSSGGAGTPSGDAGAKLALTEIFTNTMHGYAIDYPTGWFIDDGGQTVILSSFDPSAGAGQDGVPANLTKIDILALEGFPLDLDARVAQIEAEAQSSQTSLEKESFTLAGGEPAVWLKLSGGMAGDSGVVVTILGDELYQLQAYGNAMPLPAIARTMRAVSAGE